MKHVSTQQDKATAEAKVLEVKKRCLDFLLEAVTQVEKRLPAARNILKGLSNIRPELPDESCKQCSGGKNVFLGDGSEDQTTK